MTNEIRDSFNGDIAQLRSSIAALLDLDDQNALTPHGIGGHAHALLSAAYVRLGNSPPRKQPVYTDEDIAHMALKAGFGLRLFPQVVKLLDLLEISIGDPQQQKEIVVDEQVAVADDTLAFDCPSELNKETAQLIRCFASALARKARDAELKYGYVTEWKRDGWMEECQANLQAHVFKGDPQDVALIAAFCWHHSWSTNPRS